jgi:hypothetical protein
MDAESIRSTMAQAAWEITKGHLRGTVALASSRRITNPPHTSEEDKERHAVWLEFSEAVEGFIREVENAGWNE